MAVVRAVDATIFTGSFRAENFERDPDEKRGAGIGGMVGSEFEP